jgi:RNA polymerase sigma-70 factor (ECF subfamily)
MSVEDGNKPGKAEDARWFSTTHWSVVLAAGRPDAGVSGQALETLCRTYWFPLYGFIRRKGYAPEDAQDLTQEFFARFLEKEYFRRADPQRGRFRSFLLTSLQHFLIHEWHRARAQKRGGGRPLLAWEELSAEGRYQGEALSKLEPDQGFDRRWATTLFQRAVSRLQEESAAAGKGEQFKELKCFLAAEAVPGEYVGVAERLGLTPGAVGVAVHRLRQRYRELVREEIAHTVASPSEVEDEMRYLIGLISGSDL